MASSSDRARGVIEFCRHVGRLKHMKRTGWVMRKVDEPETITAHMYRMALLTQCLDRDVDVVKCMKMALIHDLGESIAGDITPHCGVSGAKKAKMESEAFEVLRKLLPREVGDEFVALFDEFEAGETKEAIAVKDLDRFDMIMQADEYETTQGMVLQEFFDSTAGKFKRDDVKSLVKELEQQREERRKQKEETTNGTVEPKE